MMSGLSRAQLTTNTGIDMEGLGLGKRQDVGDWITNISSLKAHWPRRAVRLYEGPPRISNGHSRELIERFELRGVYLGEDLEKPYQKYPLCRNPEEYEKALREREEFDELLA